MQLGLARESIRRQAETQEQTASDAFDNPREGKTRQPLQEGGMRPAHAEHSRMWEALGQGEKAGCEGDGHDPQRAGTGASGCRAGQLQSQPTRTAVKQTTGNMQFNGIPQPQRRLHREARRRISRPLTWSAAEPATADEKAGRSGT